MAPRQRKGKKKVSDQEKQAARSVSVKPSKTQPSQHRDEESDRKTALVILLVAFLVYISNGESMMGNDAVGNMYFPMQLMRGRVWWRPYDNPFLFSWKMKADKTTWEDIYAPSTMDDIVYFKNQTSTNMTAREMYRRKQFFFVTQKYMLVPIKKDVEDNRLTGNERYVNTFNIGTGITFTPFVAVLALFYGFDLNALQKNTWLLFHLSKLVASLLVASSGALVFLSASTFPSVSQKQAVAVAFVYCFCTCTWSVSSQALWQHGANEFYLSLAVFALTAAVRRHTDGKGWSARMVALCGFSVGMATLSRPTSVIVAVSIGLYLLLLKRSVKMSLVYAAGGSLLAAVQLYYNWFCFDSPFEFGQLEASRNIAVHRTGSPDLWQTPLFTGAATLLFSPNRGLFIFSPLTVFTIPAFYLVWLPSFRGKEEPKNWFDEKKASARSGNEFEVLRPLVLSVLILWTTAFKFFDYWGGWCYGYRPLLDTMPMLILLLCVVINKVEENAKAKYVILALVVWSLVVQFVGATACTNHMWNTREAILARINEQETEIIFDMERARELHKKDPSITFEEINLNIDRPEYRYRLWSWSDSQILFYIQNYEKAKEIKPLQNEAFRRFG